METNLKINIIYNKNKYIIFIIITNFNYYKIRNVISKYIFF